MNNLVCICLLSLFYKFECHVRAYFVIYCHFCRFWLYFIHEHIVSLIFFSLFSLFAQQAMVTLETLHSSRAATLFHPQGQLCLPILRLLKFFLHGTLFSSLMFTLGGLWPSWSEGQMSAICWCMPNECILFYSDAWVGLYRQQPDFRIQIFRKR